MEIICPTCGAENYDSARYCRKCGTQLGSSEFHEAPTRSLEPERAQVPPPARGLDTFGSAPLAGEPARYTPPSMPPANGAVQAMHTGMPGRVQTGAMQGAPPAKKTNWLLIVGGIIL